ncbi:epoxide hydrolase, soluble (sEH) [Chytriomyces hyalinus]|nr:epoxide hydrolase, soluble (sEH) [Chytriomyces hyalinus]
MLAQSKLNTPQDASFAAFKADHDDVVHDVEYDYYGKHIATCSSDQRIKVWRLKESSAIDAEMTPEWTTVDSWKAHDGSIAKVAWAHPEFGNVIASCSLDRTVKIWEEHENEPLNSGRRWKLKATIADCKAMVQGIEFAPHHLGLKLATCSADGWVRIYEAADIMNIANWTLSGEFEAAPGSKETDQLCISWCPSRLQPQQLVVGCGDQNVARIYRLNANNQWTAFEHLPKHLGQVTDVAWAPNMGRSYQLIATGCKDNHVRFYKLTWEDASKTDEAVRLAQTTAGIAKGKWRVELASSFNDHQSEVWRVDWNIIGTVLSSCGLDGTVRLWKSTYLGDWSCCNVINGE